MVALPPPNAYATRPTSAQDELARLQVGLRSARAELDEAASVFVEGSEAAMVLEAHRLMHGDAALADSAAKLIEDENLSAEWALSEATAELVSALSSSGSSYLKERSHDVEQVCAHIIRSLPGITPASKRDPIAETEGAVVFVTEDIGPAEVVRLASRSAPTGLACKKGSATSHTLILARALHLPCLVGLEETTKDRNAGETDSSETNGNRSGAIKNLTDLEAFTWALLDCNTQTLTLSLAKSPRAAFDEVNICQLIIDAQSDAPPPSKVELCGDAQLAINLSHADVKGCEEIDVGLFRSEFDAMVLQGRALDEALLVERYTRVARSFRSVTIRLFDFGGDKGVPVGFETERVTRSWEHGARWLLSNPTLLRTQLRAILRAADAAPNKLRILIPMVRSLSELGAFRKQLEQEAAALKVSPPPLGVMIEVPAVAMMAKEFGAACDFLSVGTNDLMQFTLAQSRLDAALDADAHCQGVRHIGFLRLLKLVSAVGGVSICGEMASDEEGLALLLALGFRHFSVDPAAHKKCTDFLAKVQLEHCKAYLDALQAGDKEAARKSRSALFDR